MHRGSLAVFIALTLATGCSKAGGPEMAAKEEAPVQNGQMPQSVQNIAYTYSFGFKIPPNRIADVQAQHLALCDQLGSRCHVVSMEQVGDTRSTDAGMELAVAASAARPFGDTLVKVVEHEGGDVTGRTIQGENLTKQMVDMEARLQGRQALADRLLGVVKTHQGSIADLVSAQKSLADVQQEIDAARAELAEARGRVAMSNIRISYAGSAGLGGFTAPIADAFASFGSIAGMSLSALLSLLAVALPWLIPAALIVLIVRWRRKGAEE
jgi:hypothetical protein